MPPYLNTEPNPQKPGAAEAIERLQVALRHLRAAKLALTDLSYAPACEAMKANDEAEHRLDCLSQDTEYAISSAGNMIEALGGKPDMESHYSGREQADAFTVAIRWISLKSENFVDVQDWLRAREQLRQMAEMAWRMA